MDTVLLVGGPAALDDRIERQLAAMQIGVVRCPTAAEALARAQRDHSRCAIVPTALTDMSAVDLLSRGRESAPELAIVVVIDHPDVASAVQVMKSGAHAVIDSHALGSGLQQHVAPLVRADNEGRPRAGALRKAPIPGGGERP